MADNIIQIKDVNGKSFDVNISKICDINGDSDGSASVKDSALKNRITVQHDLKVVNAKGEAIDSAQLLKDANDGKVNIVALDVDMEATHSGKNHNHCIYYEDSMEKDSESFMNPFHKPMLKNHDDYSEPLGRVIQAVPGPSQLTDERSAIHLKVRVTDQDAIPKFLDKRYGTVSIGGSMGTVTCNICGKTILKNGKFHFCGHWRGETYKDQVCYWGARDIEYHEVSVVNNPADDFAQIMKVTVLTDKDTNQDNKNKEENSMGGSDSTETNVDEIIDQALGTTPTAEVQDSTTPVENQTQEPNAAADGSTEAGQATDESGQTPADTTDGQTPASTEEEPKPDEKDAKITSLEKELADARAKIEELETEAIDAQSQIETLTKTAEDARTEANNFKQRCVALATANKEAIVDSIISKESFENDDAKDERRKDLMIKSMKELKSIKASTQQTGVRRTQASITSPCLAVEDPVSNGIDSTTDANKTTQDNRNIKTVNDAAQEVIKRLFK